MNLLLEIPKTKDALLAWVNTFSLELSSPITELSDLTDGIILKKLLNQLDSEYFFQFTAVTCNEQRSMSSSISKLQEIYNSVQMYAKEILHWKSSSVWDWNLSSTYTTTMDPIEIEKLVSFILVVAVYSPSNQWIISNIQTLSPSYQKLLMQQIELYRCVPSSSTANSNSSSSSSSFSPLITSKTPKTAFSPLLQSEWEALTLALTQAEEKRMEIEEKYQTQVHLNQELTKKWEQLNMEVVHLNSYKSEVEELKQVRDQLKLAETRLEKSKLKLDEVMTTKKQSKELELQLAQATTKVNQLQEELAKTVTYRTQLDSMKKKVQLLEHQKIDLESQLQLSEKRFLEAKEMHLHSLEALHREQHLVKELEEKIKELEWMNPTSSFLGSPKRNPLESSSRVLSTLDLQKYTLKEAEQTIETLTKENEHLKQQLTTETSIPKATVSSVETELEQKWIQCQKELEKVIQEKNDLCSHYRREQQLMASAWYKLQYHRNPIESSLKSGLNFFSNLSNS